MGLHQDFASQLLQLSKQAEHGKGPPRYLLQLLCTRFLEEVHNCSLALCTVRLQDVLRNGKPVALYARMDSVVALPSSLVVEKEQSH